MLTVGETDAFERRYMEKFRVFASRFGEFVRYEHDRGARDIGLHLTHKLESHQERVSSCLCWFQMKGIMKDTLSRRKFNDQDGISIPLKVKHLKYWYLQPMPTYLTVYIESVDQFLVLNIQKYISQKWDREILSLNKETTTVYVSKDSILDEQAFDLILFKSDVEEWKKALGCDQDSSFFCRRDYDFIWNLGVAEERQVKHCAVVRTYLTKLRGEIHFLEYQSLESNSKTLQEHFQFLMDLSDLEIQYPYLNFFDLGSTDSKSDFEVDGWDEQDPDIIFSPLVLSNGEKITGTKPCGNEFIEYSLGFQLNDLGVELVAMIQFLVKSELLEVNSDKRVKSELLEVNSDKSASISIAPWHSRDV